MTQGHANPYSLDAWSQHMGGDLPQSESQPLQPVMVKDGKLKVFTDTLRTRFSPGARIGFRLQGNRIPLVETPDGIAVEDGGVQELELSEAVRSVLPQEEPLWGLIVSNHDHLELQLIRVQEHAPDILGPRIIDELQCPSGAGEPVTIVRQLSEAFHMRSGLTRGSGNRRNSFAQHHSAMIH